MKAFSTPLLLIIIAMTIVLLGNISFFKQVIAVYPLNSDNFGFILSLGLVLYALIVIMLSLFAFNKTLKPLLVMMIFLTTTIAYFMQNYSIVTDKTMIENILQTDTNETLDLLSSKLFIQLFLFALLPSLLLYKLPLKYRSFKSALWSNLKMIVLHLLLIAILLFAFSKFYTSFFREHRSLRLYTNPITGIYSSVAYTYAQFKQRDIPMKIIGQDAQIIDKVGKKRKIVIMVVGEAARADHFSLNGYAQETNPLLKKESIINFPQMYSCGTTTAVSVPCMFSRYTRSEYTTQKGYNTYNVLDILAKAGVEVLWRDNNSDSKGVAVRLNYQNYKTNTRNTLCEGECRDEGMLIGLDKVLSATQKDMIIVLHQMGNHGPAYYKRYPKAFEKFTPICSTNQLEDCSKEEISNAYDNALRYTDYFLSKVIAFLKPYSQEADTAMIYIADHGESLGENRLYLHGLPYFIAPTHQKHVGALMWFADNYPIDQSTLRKSSQKTYSHDHLFFSLLGLFGVQTNVYDKKMDIFYPLLKR